MKDFKEKETQLSTQIIEFLKNHPLISLNKLEKKIKMRSQGTLSRCISTSKPIPSIYIFPLIYELGNYGIKIDGYDISPDSDTPHIFLKKEIGLAECVEEEEGYFIYIQKQNRSIACDLSDLIS